MITIVKDKDDIKISLKRPRKSHTDLLIKYLSSMSTNCQKCFNKELQISSLKNGNYAGATS